MLEIEGSRDRSAFCVSVFFGMPSTGDQLDEVFVRVGRYGPFLEQAERRASIPDSLPPDELTIDKLGDAREASGWGRALRDRS